jgi:hypothetical protein
VNSKKKAMGYSDNNWAKRRFYDFRNGHTIYLAFTMNFVQFVVIFYSLAIERFNFLQTIFPAIWEWVAFFVAVYIPAAVIIGHWHITNQWRAEVKQSTRNNPYTYYTSEGKEQMYNLPSAVIDYRIKTKQMNMQNNIAEAVETMAKTLGVKVPEIQRFGSEDFEGIAYCEYLAQGLQDGKNIMDLISDKNTVKAVAKQEQPIVVVEEEKKSS